MLQNIYLTAKKTTFISAFLIIILFVYIPSLYFFLSIISVNTTSAQTTSSLGYPAMLQFTDSREYFALSENLINFKTFSSKQNLYPDTFRTPGYPIFLAVHKLIFKDYLWAVFSQILLVILTSVLIFEIGNKMLSIWAGFFASVAYILDPSTIFASFHFTNEILFVFLIISATYFLFFYKFQYAYFTYCVAGFLVGCAVLTKPIGVFLPFLISLFVIIQQRNYFNFRNICQRIFLFIFFFSLMVAPWAIRNKSISGVFDISSITAFNLFTVNIAGFLESKPDDMKKLSTEINLNFEEMMDLKNAQRIKSGVFKYISQNLFDYLKFHFLSTYHFFFGSGVRWILNNLNPFFGRDLLSVVGFKNLAFEGSYIEISHFLKSNPFYILVLMETLWWIFITLLAIIPLFNLKLYFNFNYLLMLSFVFYFAILTGPGSLAASTSRYRLLALPFLLLAALINLDSFRDFLKRRRQHR